MPRYCCPLVHNLVEILLYFRIACQDHQAGESAVKSLSQIYNRMAQHSTMLPTLKTLLKQNFQNFKPTHFFKRYKFVTVVIQATKLTKMLGFIKKLGTF